MPVLNRDDFLARVQSVVGDDTDDDTLALIADFTDTFDDLTNRADGNEWKTKYEAEHTAHENLRKEYRDRFFSGGGHVEPPADPPAHGAAEITFDDLFK